MKGLMRASLIAPIVLFLAACGGGGGSSGATPSGTSGGTTTTTTTPASLEIYASSSQLSSARNSSVSFTVVAKDSSNRAIPGQSVDFTASSGSLTGAVPSPKTGTNGEAITSVTLSPGVDPTNRDIVVTATSGSLSRSITIPVRGTTLAVSGSSAVLSGGTIPFTVKATDSGGAPISGARLIVTSTLGNSVTSASGFLTNSLGVASFNYVGGTSGLDSVTVTGLGTSAVASVSVSGDDFSFTQPASGSTITVGTGQAVSVRLLVGGIPQSGVNVSFSTTRGSVSGPTVPTNGSGIATTLVSSTTAGPATITARSSTGAQVTLPLTYVAITPATLTLQPSLSALPPNPSGSQSSQSTLVAMVRDASGNPVTGQVVSFTALSDGSGGTISPATGVTDFNGQVITQFVPGALTTAANGVNILASVVGSNVTGSAQLTVSGQAVFITIGVGNELANYDTDTYQQQLAISVVDALGNPVRNRDVQLSIYPLRYYKGVLVRPTGQTTWVRDPNAIFCPNEDKNRNGILDTLGTSEDQNGNLRLDPGLPAVVAPGTVTTNDVGFATFYLRYGEDKAPWVDLEITARALVAGTESSARLEYPLVMTTADAANPAGFRSPYGTATDCTDPD